MGLQVDRARGYGACAACRTSHNLVPYGTNIERYTVSPVAASLQQVFFLAFIYNSFHHIMALLRLPHELLSRVCRFIGVDYQRLRYENKNFGSLRLTCKEIYQKTMFDAVTRYGPMLHELSIRFDYQSLCRILTILKIEKLRDRIVSVTLDPGMSRDLLHPSFLYIRGEETETFIGSSEAVHLLAECFRWLAKAEHLTKLYHSRSDSLHVSLAALVAVQFPIKLDIVYESSDNLIHPGHGDFGRSPATYVPHISCISTEWGVSGISDYDDELQRDLVEHRNEGGFHVRNYRLRHPAVASFFLGLRDIAHLHISGCICEPYLRFCNACDDTFTHNIFKVAFNQLTTFHLIDMYISGGRLRRFLREKGHTLTDLRFTSIALTDGSWKIIARGLEKLPLLCELALEDDLWQKRAVPRLQSQLPVYQCEDAEDGIPSVRKVRHYLEFFIKNFCTSIYVDSGDLP